MVYTYVRMIREVKMDEPLAGVGGPVGVAVAASAGIRGGVTVGLDARAAADEECISISPSSSFDRELGVPRRLAIRGEDGEPGWWVRPSTAVRSSCWLC